MDQDDPLDIAIGARVRTIREARRMPQSGLGKALGVSFQQIQKSVSYTHLRAHET